METRASVSEQDPFRREEIKNDVQFFCDVSRERFWEDNTHKNNERDDRNGMKQNQVDCKLLVKSLSIDPS